MFLQLCLPCLGCASVSLTKEKNGNRVFPNGKGNESWRDQGETKGTKKCVMYVNKSTHDKCNHYYYKHVLIKRIIKRNNTEELIIVSVAMSSDKNEQIYVKHRTVPHTLNTQQCCQSQHSDGSFLSQLANS